VVTRIRSPLDAVADGVELHYGRHPLEGDGDFADFHVSIERPRGIRHLIKPQVVFKFDGDVPFAPLPGDQGFPMLEWGLNWCVHSHCHQYLIIHAAVLERGGRALILPAPSGSGKSTLCAGLAFSGWRLLSDELALIEPATGALVPLPRPISLKNASIEVIRKFAPHVKFSRVVHETTKGSVAHAQPPSGSVERGHHRAMPGWIVLPRYAAGEPALMTPLPKGKACMHLVDNAFNYNVHGRRGFHVLTDLVDRSGCYEFSYSRLGDAVALFDELAAHNPQ
jgi:HprK-related kinase A